MLSGWLKFPECVNVIDQNVPLRREAVTMSRHIFSNVLNSAEALIDFFLV